MKNKIKKYFNFICAIVVLLTTILPNLTLIGTAVFAATATVQYNGKATYGGSTVGDFSINGEQAFCMEHSKTTPGTGVEVTSSVYDREDIAKCLYYRLDRTRSMEWFYFIKHGNSNNIISIRLLL